MRLNRIILSCIIASFVLITNSCEDVDENRPIFDSVNGITLVTFQGAATTLPVEIGTTADVTVNVQSTTVSDVDRTFNLVIDETATTLNSENYVVPSSVTIPAGEHVSSFVVSGVDSNNLTTEGGALVFSLSVDTPATTEGNYTVLMNRTCPLDDTFGVGTYQVFTSVGCFGGGQTCFTSGGEVEVSSLGGPIRRFSGSYLPNFGGFSATLTFSLVCGEVFITEDFDVGVGCAVTPEDIVLGAPVTRGTFDPNDDSTITIRFGDDIGADCNGPTDAEIVLVKV